MPELPEVEIYKRNLVSWCGERCPVGVRIYDPSLVVTKNATILDRDLRHLPPSLLRRVGKFLIWPDGHGLALVTHLRMTGKWIHRLANDPLRFVRAELLLSDTESLAFVDARRLGQWWWGSEPDVVVLSGLSSFGPDLMDSDLTAEVLVERLRGSGRSIKQMLLDQRVVAGIGNIIASEGCFRAHIHPEAIAGNLSFSEISSLISEIRAHCEEVIRDNQGAPITYQGEPGAKNAFLVYGRDGHPCRRCGNPIRRKVHGGRATYFCAVCQRV